MNERSLFAPINIPKNESSQEINHKESKPEINPQQYDFYVGSPEGARKHFLFLSSMADTQGSDNPGKKKHKDKISKQKSETSDHDELIFKLEI